MNRQRPLQPPQAVRLDPGRNGGHIGAGQPPRPASTISTASPADDGPRADEACASERAAEDTDDTADGPELPGQDRPAELTRLTISTGETSRANWPALTGWPHPVG